MAGAHAEVSGRPVGGRGKLFLRLLLTMAILSGAAALGLAAMGWLVQLGPPKDARQTADRCRPDREGVAAVGHLLRQHANSQGAELA